MRKLIVTSTLLLTILVGAAGAYSEDPVGFVAGAVEADPTDTSSAAPSSASMPAFDYPGSGCWASAGCTTGAVSGDFASGQY